MDNDDLIREGKFKKGGVRPAPPKGQWANNNFDVFSKEELDFLTKIERTGREPYSTMASDAILWGNRKILESLKGVMF